MKICISRLDKMGDMILSLPAIKAIKVANPNIYISVLASSQNAKVLKGLDYIDKINIINNSCQECLTTITFTTIPVTVPY